MRLNVDEGGLPAIKNIRPAERVISAEETVPAIEIISTVGAVLAMRVGMKLSNTVPAVVSAVGVG